MKKKEAETAVRATLVGWLMSYALSTVGVTYTFYWLFGIWLPWFGSMLAGIFIPIVTPTWLILWLLHFVPCIVWPLLAGHIK